VFSSNFQSTLGEPTELHVWAFDLMAFIAKSSMTAWRRGRWRRTGWRKAWLANHCGAQSMS